MLLVHGSNMMFAFSFKIMSLGKFTKGNQKILGKKLVHFSCSAVINEVNDLFRFFCIAKGPLAGGEKHSF